MLSVSGLGSVEVDYLADLVSNSVLASSFSTCFWHLIDILSLSCFVVLKLQFEGLGGRNLNIAKHQLSLVDLSTDA